jgi:DNA-binding transcriptional LysR family regulator
MEPQQRASALFRFWRVTKLSAMEVALVDRSVNPLEEGFDVALGGMSASYCGVLDEPLCQLGQVVFASPEYLERRGTPKHPRDLADHECLVFHPTGATWMFRTH